MKDSFTQQTGVSQSDQGKTTSLVKICWTLYLIKGTYAGVNHSPLWDNDSLHSFYPLQRSDQWAVSLRNVDGWKSLSLVDTSDLVSGRFSGADAAFLTAAIRNHFGWGSGLAENATIRHLQQKYHIFRTFRFLRNFKRHFSNKRVNGSYWIQGPGSCSSGLLAFPAPRKVSSILVTNSARWSRLNEIKKPIPWSDASVTSQPIDIPSPN